jgi:puromycin-sensitive aminopeptidase
MTEVSIDAFRLGRSVIPQRYDIHLSPDLENSSFAGEETISVQVETATAMVTLNSLELEIHSVSAEGPDGSSLIASAEVDDEHEQLRLTFPAALSVGDWKIRIDFGGRLNEKLAGFYRSTYLDASGNDRVLAATQFESTDARRAFPCWDEPAFKAVYGLALTINKDLTAIANAPVTEEVEAGDGKKRLRFADTIRMSTYLVAFIVGDFESGEPVSAGGVPLRVWAIRGKERLTSYAREIGAFALSFFADYYGIAYPGAKLDLVAIPDFAAGAMENFGAVTFRETALLVDTATATKGELERVAVVVAHELAHMWFGDLVTMQWWNGLWLNEAFATFMEMLAVDAWRPEWETWLSFGSDRAGAQLIDGLQSTRPIEFPVQRPEEAQAMFDVLTYQKGAAVLRMLQQYLGEQTFQEGVNLYLRKHAYGNTETGDLWDALEEASGQPVRKTMDSWIFQAGYPLVNLELTGKDQLAVSQQRFLYLADNRVGGSRSDGSLWQVPVIVRTSAPARPDDLRLLLGGAQAQLRLPEGSDWVVGNAGGNGFYRVQYVGDLFTKLLPHVQRDLSAIERFNLVSDTWSATLAGYTSLKDYLDLTALYRDEMDETVWTMLVGTLAGLRRMMGDQERPAIATITRNRLTELNERLGWDPAAGESDRTRELRGTVLGTIGVLGDDPAIQEEAVRRYEDYRNDVSSVDPNIVPALVGILAAIGDRDRYEEFWNSFKSAKTPQEEQRYLFALAGFRDERLLATTLSHTLDGEVRTQDAPYLVRAVMANKRGAELAWSFTKDHWNEMTSRYPENAVTRMCEGVTSLTTPELEQDVRAFFSTHEVKQAGKQLDQHLERLHMGVLFRQRESANLRSYAIS